MFVFPSYHILYKDTAEIKEELFTYLKEYACFDEVVHDVEEDMDEEVPETEPESQITLRVVWVIHQGGHNFWQKGTILDFRTTFSDHLRGTSIQSCRMSLIDKAQKSLVIY